MLLRSLVIAITGFIGLSVSPVVNAAGDNICIPKLQQVWQQRQAWNMIDDACPIGDGIWSQVPSFDGGQFWVQCGTFKSFPESGFAAELAKVAEPYQIILRKETNSYRCLIGPFERYTVVKEVRDNMRKLPLLKDAFIRSVKPTDKLMQLNLNATKPNEIAKAKSVEPQASKPAETQKPSLPPKAPIGIEPATNNAKAKEITPKIEKMLEQAVPTVMSEANAQKPAEPTVMATPAAPVPDFGQEPKKPALNKTLKSPNDPHREYVEIAGVLVPKPKQNELHHVEGNEVWWRANLAEANKACEDMGTTLITSQTLREKVQDPANKSMLPKRLPFWVAEQSAFDVVMMVTIPLTNNSALYVLCEPKK